MIGKKPARTLAMLAVKSETMLSGTVIYFLFMFWK
jgi:hypothetical protein